MIRLFQFKNNFIGEEIEQIEAEYSAFGYFDGLVLGLAEEENKAEALLSDPFYFLVDNKNALLEECDYFNVAGICQDDKSFWEANDLPFIFITFVRMKKRSRNMEKIISEISGKAGEGDQKKTQCYRTYDSSDLIICMRTKRYSSGYCFIESYRDIVQSVDKDNCLQKSFSICVIKQETLDNIMDNAGCIENEKVSCNLRCLVRNIKKASDFCRELQELGMDVQNYGILGSEDWIISVRDIDMVRFLDMYKKEGRLTHKAYKDTFMNVMTEVLVKKEGCENGDYDISGDSGKPDKDKG